MKVFEAIKRGFKGGNGLLNVAGIFFAYNVVTGLLSLPLADPERAGETWVMAIAIVLAVISFAVFIFLQGGAMGIIKDYIKTGRADLSRFIDYGRKFYSRILLLFLTYLLIGIFVVLGLTILQGLTYLLDANPFLGILLLVILVFLAFAAIVLLIYPLYTIVVEDKSVLESFKKGIKVAKENYLRTLGLFLLLFTFGVIVSLLVAFIGTLIAAPFPIAVENVIITVVNAVAQSYIPIVMMVAFMSFYMTLIEPGASESEPDPGSDLEGSGHSEAA